MSQTLFCRKVVFNNIYVLELLYWSYNIMETNNLNLRGKLDTDIFNMN